jgi:membrane protein implicated in regulation of membrane protease activity
MDIITELGLHWFWFALAGILLVIEAFHGRFIFLAVSAAALAVGVMTHLYPYVGFQIQLLFFVVLSGAFTWFARAYLRERQAGFRHLQELVEKRGYVGRVLVLVNPIKQGRATIDIDGMVWNLRGPDLPSGARVKVVDMGEGWLRVEPEE